MPVLLIVYVLCSAIGLTLIRMGLSQGTLISLSDNVLRIHLGLLLVGGITLYVISFLFSLVVMSKMSLSTFYPLSAGLIYVVVCVLALVLLKESIDLPKAIGMVLILMGIVAMNLRKA